MRKVIEAGVEVEAGVEIGGVIINTCRVTGEDRITTTEEHNLVNNLQETGRDDSDPPLNNMIFHINTTRIVFQQLPLRTEMLGGLTTNNMQIIRQTKHLVVTRFLKTSYMGRPTKCPTLPLIFLIQ